MTVGSFFTTQRNIKNFQYFDKNLIKKSFAAKPINA